jgi:hypothetical protein
MTGQLEKGERIVNIGHNVRYTHSSVCTVYDNADRITESAKSATSVCVAKLCSPIAVNSTKNCVCESHTYCIRNKYVV